MSPPPGQWIPVPELSDEFDCAGPEPTLRYRDDHASFETPDHGCTIDTNKWGRLLGGRRQYDDGVAMLTSMEERRQEEVPPSAAEAAAESNAGGYVRVVKADGSTAWVKVRDLAMT